MTDKKSIDEDMGNWLNVTVTCSRCKTIVDGMQSKGCTAGFYRVTKGIWAAFARDNETILCDACMLADPAYVKEYGGAKEAVHHTECEHGVPFDDERDCEECAVADNRMIGMIIRAENHGLKTTIQVIKDFCEQGICVPNWQKAILAIIETKGDPLLLGKKEECPMSVVSVANELYMTPAEDDIGIPRESTELALLTINFSNGHKHEYLHVLGERKERLEKELQDMEAIRGKEVM